MAELHDDLFLGVFAEPDDVVEATKACREAGFTFQDVYAPFAVHGLDRAMGLPFSKITWVTFLCGAMGTTIALTGMGYISAWDWPLNIGGKAPFPLPAMIPITFELTVLIGGVCTFLGLLAMCRIWPGKRTRLYHPRQTDDRFVIALECDEAFNEARAREIFAAHHAEEVSRVAHDHDASPLAAGIHAQLDAESRAKGGDA
jgi:hypothetical protein